MFLCTLKLKMDIYFRKGVSYKRFILFGSSWHHTVWKLYRNKPKKKQWWVNWELIKNWWFNCTFRMQNWYREYIIVDFTSFFFSLQLALKYHHQNMFSIIWLLDFVSVKKKIKHFLVQAFSFWHLREALNLKLTKDNQVSYYFGRMLRWSIGFS